MSAARLAMAAAGAAAAFVVGAQVLDENLARLVAIVAAILVMYLTKPSGDAAKPASASPAKLERAHELVLAKAGGKPAGLTGVESVVEVNDFEIVDSKPIDFLALFKERPQDITPYTVDVDRGCIIFVDVDADVLRKHKLPFIYQAQRAEARRVFAVPFDEAEKAMRALDEDKTWGSLSQVMFVHSTGRCGSTLFSKVLDNLASVSSISEPDIYSMCTALLKLSPEKFSVADCERVFRVGTFFHTYTALKQKPVDVVCFKTRSFVLEFGDIFKRAVPESKAIFLYRNAMDVVDSYCMAFYNHFVGRLARRFGLDSYVLFKTGKLPSIFPVIAPLMQDSAYSKEVYESLGAVGLFTMGWLSCMDSAVRLNKAGGIDALLRYEELTTQKVHLAKKVLQKCGFKITAAENEEAMEKVFAADAHGEDSRTVSARRLAKVDGPMYIRPEDYSKMCDLIACHKVIQKPDYVIPGTLL